MNKGLLLLLAGAAALWYFSKQQPAMEVDEALVQAWIAKMKADPAWYAAEVQKAAERGISIDEMLRIDALWIISQGWQLT